MCHYCNYRRNEWPIKQKLVPRVMTEARFLVIQPENWPKMPAMTEENVSKIGGTFVLRKPFGWTIGKDSEDAEIQSEDRECWRCRSLDEMDDYLPISR